MEQVTSKLTVFFEDPFWVGVYERISGVQLEVCKITFGAEPKDFEVYDLFLRRYAALRFSPPVKTSGPSIRRINPKRMQREISRQISDTGVGTKAQQALKLQQEQNKLERKSYSRQRREEKKQRQFELRQQKKKEKRRGR